MKKIEKHGIQIGRFITRPGAGTIAEIVDPDNHSAPDLIMGVLFKSGRDLLKGNKVYELVLNEITGILELHEIGNTNMSKWWGRNYYDIHDETGPVMWLTQDEYNQHMEQQEASYMDL